MQNGIGLERFVERFKFLLDPGIFDGKHGAFECDAKACQSRPVIAERMDK